MNSDTTLSIAKLQLSIDVPNLEEVWLEGYESAQFDQAETSNPYSKNSSEFQFWCDGWWAGFYGEEPLFNLAGEVNPQALEKPQVNTPTLATAKPNSSWFSRFSKAIGAIITSLAIYELIDLMA